MIILIVLNFYNDLNLSDLIHFFYCTRRKSNLYLVKLIYLIPNNQVIERMSIMSKETLFFWVIIDPLTFILGSIGGYILFHEVVEMDHLPRFFEIIKIIRRRWLAWLSLAISVIYFFYRLVTLLQNN